MDVWKGLEDGIYFEKSNTFLKWNISVRKLKDIGNPIVTENAGRIEIEWEGETLLDGIEGNWTTSYFPHEWTKQFKSIQLLYLGDEQSFNEFSKMKRHLLDKLGKPLIQDENNDEKEIKWQHGNYYVYLYLFEMHAYRCVLKIGID